MDKLETAQQSIKDDLEALNRAYLALDTRVIRSLVSEMEHVEVTPKGIFITPLGNPNVFAHQLGSLLGVEWTRERDASGLYQWVTTYDLFNTLVYIMANESIDQTGTPIQTYPL